MSTIFCDKATFDVLAFIPQVDAIPERQKNDAIFFRLLRLKYQLPLGE